MPDTVTAMRCFTQTQHLLFWMCLFILSISMNKSQAYRESCQWAYSRVSGVSNFIEGTQKCKNYSTNLATLRYKDEYTAAGVKDTTTLIMLDAYDEADISVFRNPDGWLIYSPHYTHWAIKQPKKNNGERCMGIFEDFISAHDFPCDINRTDITLIALCARCIPDRQGETKVCSCRNGNVVSPGRSCRGCLEMKIQPNLVSTTPCRPNRYGPDCQRQCHCKDDKPCNINTGSCDGECKHNWKGPKCDETDCPLRTWGKSCEKHCFCGLEQQCDVIGGLCLVNCYKGLVGLHCQQSTCKIFGKFGPKCERNCHCKPDVACSGVDGRCASYKGCSRTWRGPFCNETICPKGSYGPRCSQYCMCKYGSQCNINTGKCDDGCEDNWIGDACNKTSCDIGKYGDDCTKECQCSFGVPCDQSSGVCLGADVSKLPACEKQGFWGFECNDSCTAPNCAKCSRLDGDKCELCKSGYYTTAGTSGLCLKVCEKEGFWGLDCNNSCTDPNCARCARFDGGECEHCSPGYVTETATSNWCFTVCEKQGFWGMDCSNSCTDPNCARCSRFHGDWCELCNYGTINRNRTTGLCFEACEEQGIWGSYCNNSCTDPNCAKCTRLDGDKCKLCNLGYATEDGTSGLCLGACKEQGFWGLDCNNSCTDPNCTRCSRFNGDECELCNHGYTTEDGTAGLCFGACEKQGFWGLDCNNSCTDPNCARCFRFDGDECELYKSRYAAENDTSSLYFKENTGMKWRWYILLLILILLLLALLAAWCIFCRKKKGKEEEKKGDLDEVPEKANESVAENPGEQDVPEDHAPAVE